MKGFHVTTKVLSSVKNRSLTKVNKTNVARILRESVFDPKKNKLMSIVTEIGSFDYYVRRAQELTATLALCKSSIQRQNALQMAISLLAIARLVDVAQIIDG